MPPSFSRLVDLAVTRNGGEVEEASDDFFAPKERLILAEDPIARPGLYTEKGKWMDGWESRRRRTPGNDWCVVRLGFPGRIHGVDVDTSHFIGNHPLEASIDVAENPVGERNRYDWTPLLPRVPLRPNDHNFFEADGPAHTTHIRLNIFPDGGVARLRIYGDVNPDWSSFNPEQVVNLSSLPNGGIPIDCSDEHFGRVMNLLRTTPPVNMGDGWETRRRRSPGHDWVVVRLGHQSQLDRLEVDTTHFKGNYPDRFSVDAVHMPNDASASSDWDWTRVVDQTKLGPDANHVVSDLLQVGPFTHVRLNIYPDGGVARFRVYGRPAVSETP